MKQLLTIALLAVTLTGCTKGTGTSEVKLIDVTWEGLLVKTCEVHAQYGQGSSNVGAFSALDGKLCEQLLAANGKDVKLKYEQTIGKCFLCDSSDLITGFEVK